MDISVVIGVDTETDIGSFTPFYNGVEKGTPLLMDLFEKKGIPATFFMVAEAAQKFPELTREIKQRGFEVGCHTIHHETIGDPLFEIPLVKPVLPEEIPHRLEVATAMIAEVIGEAPQSFRAPRLWGSTIMVNTLEKLGYLADATYPLYYYQERVTPYYPSAKDWTQEGNLSILEIPNFADLTIESHDQYGRDRDQWPLFRTEGAESLMKHVNSMIAYCADRNLPAVFCFYIHPWEFIEMPSRLSYGEATVEPLQFIIKNCGPRALTELSKVIDAFKDKGAHFYSAAGLAHQWRESVKES
jgi:peptidoglycan/xylan/chitin deacetylase (PgdA/CDA1 family)